MCGEFLANTLDKYGSEPMSANVATLLNAMQKWYLEKTKQKLPEGQIPLGDFVVGEYKKYEERFQAKVASLNANQNLPTPPKVLQNEEKKVVENDQNKDETLKSIVYFESQQQNNNLAQRVR